MRRPHRTCETWQLAPAGKWAKRRQVRFLRGLRLIRSSHRRRSLRFPEPIQHDPTDLGQGQGRAVQWRVLFRSPIGIVEVDNRARGNLSQIVDLEVIVGHVMLAGGDELANADPVSARRGRGRGGTRKPVLLDSSVGDRQNTAGSFSRARNNPGFTGVRPSVKEVLRHRFDLLSCHWPVAFRSLVSGLCRSGSRRGSGSRGRGLS